MNLPDAQLFDWRPVWQLLLLGTLVAVGPMLWVAWRSRGEGPMGRMRRLTWVTLFLTFDLILFGAFTRLTDSGLGCPDWPGCYGHASPVGAGQHIQQAVQTLPDGPVTHLKAWVEMLHRYLASGVGALILVMTAMAWLQRKRLNLSPWWPTASLVWVCVQGAFGALTVTMKLFPAIVTLHLLGAMLLLALLRRQAHALDNSAQAPTGGVAPNWWWHWALAYGLLWGQIALGGWVSTNYAVLACTDFPACQGSWWPAMDFASGFSLWRELGERTGGEPLPFEALTAIHWVHRLAAAIVLPVLATLAWRLRHRDPVHARWLAGLIAWQALTGLSNVVLGWPLVAAVSHTGGAAALIVVLTAVPLAARRFPARAGFSIDIATTRGVHA